MIKTREVQKFLTNFQQELPENFATFADMLQDLQEGKCSPEDIYQHARELLRSNLSLINYFNKFIVPLKQIQVLTKAQKEYMIDHLLNNIYKFNSELGKKLSKISIEIGKQKFDDINFYSYEDLSSQYIEALQEQKYLEMIGRSEFKMIKKILNDFIQNSIQDDKFVIELRENQSNEKQLLNNNNCKQQVVVNKEDFRKENQLFDLIERILSPEEFEIFLKLFWIYHLNIISYVEFVKTIENILINLDKQTCLSLKTAIENREQNRALRNCFNIKNQLETIPEQDFNQSYKKINSKGLVFLSRENSLINKKYACIPKGHEAFTTEDQASKNQIKNISEEELLKVEDEMHEFDVILTQFRVVKNFVLKLQRNQLTEQQKNKMLNKISNINLFGYLYGKKAFQIFDIIRENPNEILPILIQRIDERIEMLINVRKDYSKNNWQKAMKISYYKALDIKANTTKILERKKLINKNLIKELNDQNFVNMKMSGQVNIVNSVQKLLHKKKENFRYQAKLGNFWNPSIIFEIGDQMIMKDICAILQIYSQQIFRSNVQEYQKCQEVIGFYIQNFFNIFENQKESQLNLKNYFENLDLENHEDLLSQCFEIEKQQLKNSKKKFLYSEKLSPKINAQKIPDMIKSIQEILEIEIQPLKKPDFEQKQKEQQENFPQMTVEKDKNDKPYNILFGSYQFYILYRYFIFLYERFQFANQHSKKVFQNKKLYQIFKKILIYNIFGVLDTQNFEDLLRIVFGQFCGIFLNFEKIFTNLFKVYKKNIFTDFIINLNWHLVSKPEYIPTQEILYAKTSHQLHELLNGTNQKNSKNNVINSFNSNYNVTNDEFLKFQFLKDQNLFIIHKVKSIFKEDQKKVFENFNQILNSFRHQIYRASQHSHLNYFSKNQIVFEVRPKRKFHFVQSNKEDLTFNLKKQQIKNCNEQKIEKKKFFEQKRKILLQRIIKKQFNYL